MNIISSVKYNNTIQTIQKGSVYHGQLSHGDQQCNIH